MLPVALPTRSKTVLRRLIMPDLPGILDLAVVHAITTLLALPGGEVVVGVLASLLLGLGGWSLMLYREIGRRRRTEAALRQEQHRLRQALSAVCDAPWELDATSGAFLHSDAWRSLLGYGPRQHGHDTHGADEVRTLESLLHPDDAPRLRAALDAVLHGTAEALAQELRFRHADGHWHWLLLRGAPALPTLPGRAARDQHSRLLLHGGLLDVHTQVESRTALQAHLQHLIRVLQALPLHVYWKDEHLQLEGSNDRPMLAHENAPEHPAGDPAGEALCRADPRRELLERQVLATGTPVQDLHEFALPPPPGHEATAARHATRTLEVRLLPLPDAHGQPRGVLGLCQDVTQRLALERELHAAKQHADEASAAKSRLLAAMSHEIRTPMNAILGMAEMLRETPLDREQEGFVQVLSTSGEALMAIINNILDLSRAESGHMQPERAPYRPAELLNRLRDLFALRCKAKGVRLEFVLDPALPDLLQGDALRLQQVLTNLLENAAKFTQVGSIRVQATLLRQRQQSVEVLFEVADTGPGIPESRQQAVFEDFVQADESTTRQYGGSGLGLALCRELTRLMGGRLWLESEIGQGSTFFLALQFELPPADAATSPVLGKPAPGGAHKTDGRALPASPPSQVADTCHVLLVEDSEYNAFVVASYLKGTTCRVTLARNGEEGLQAFGRGGFDLVLMDMQMPVMDGYTATRAIRELESTRGLPPTPVLAMTAHTMDEHREQSLAAGCSAHLPKPVSRRDLLVAIERFTGKQVLRGASPADQVELPGSGTLPAAVLSTEETCSLPPTMSAVQDGSPIPICVDPELKGLAPTFLQAIRSKIAPFRRSLTAQDMEPLARLGHQLKGEGAAFGFPILGDVGARLEQAARREDAAAAAAMLSRLQDVLDRIVMV